MFNDWYFEKITRNGAVLEYEGLFYNFLLFS